MYSMTGYGSATRDTRFGRLQVEMRAVNNRFLELGFRLGTTFIHLESAARGLLRERLRRGKVDVQVRFEPSEAFVPSVRVNVAVLRSLVDQLGAAGLASDGGVRAESLLTLPGVLLNETDPASTEELDAAVLELIGEAAANLLADRAREGEGIRAACRAHQARMAECAAAVAATRDDVVAKYRERLHQRIEELLGPKAASLDPGRLEQEVTIFADKADIAEECQRLGAHLEALGDLIEKDGEALGRQLDFLSQEILREINTTGSKCRDLDIARQVLELKKECESLKEQIANIE
ncbi:MAG: YicC family protein [Candidatus Sumerlaeia bacterium]|nr:YicC family protein [Candidatus Sumerlaeia bacterium]